MAEFARGVVVEAVEETRNEYFVAVDLLRFALIPTRVLLRHGRYTELGEFNAE